MDIPIGNIFEKKSTLENVKQVSSETSNVVTTDDSKKKETQFPDVNLIIRVQQGKILHLKEVQKHINEKLLTTEFVIKALYTQFASLQRYILRRHMKICKYMINDLNKSFHFLNKQTSPFFPIIDSEHKLWKEELEETNQRLANLKDYTMKAIMEGENLNFYLMMKTPLFVKDLKSTKSILHKNFVAAYRYLINILNIQENSIKCIQNLLEQKKIIKDTIPKINEALLIPSQIIANSSIQVNQINGFILRVSQSTSTTDLNNIN